MTSQSTNAAPALSGQFSCYTAPGFMDHGRRILYIGKATKGEFGEEDVHAQSFNGTSAFWDFARKISKLADPNCTDLSNVAWSNIFKQGVTNGNPSGDLAEAQRESAIEELRKEVLQLEPSLIVLVTAGYYEEIPKSAFDIADGEVGERALRRTRVNGEDKVDLWSRPQLGTIPPIVWMYHPQGKRQAYIDAALNLIKATAAWA